MRRYRVHFRTDTGKQPSVTSYHPNTEEELNEAMAEVRLARLTNADGETFLVNPFATTIAYPEEVQVELT